MDFDANEEWSLRPKRLAGFTLAVAAFAFGASVNGRWLAGEAARMPMWMFSLSFLGEAAAFIWCVMFVFEPRGAGAQAHRSNAFLISIGLAYAASIAVGAWHYYEEEQGRVRSVATIADLKDFTGKHSARAHVYTFKATFKDRAGAVQDAYFYLNNDDLPRGAVPAFMADQPPAQIGIRYDPQYPRRAWIQDPGSDPNENRLYMMNASVMIFSLFLTVISTRRRGNWRSHVAWHHIVPFVSLTAVLAFTGAAKMMTGDF